MKINKNMTEYNSTIKVIGETYYPIQHNNKPYVIKWNQLALFSKENKLIKEVYPVSGQILSPYLIPSQIIKKINSTGSYMRSDMQMGSATCLIDKQGKIIESSKEIKETK
jgi:hypothetical protein